MTADSGARGGGDLPGLAARATSGDAAAVQSLLAGVWPDAYHMARSLLRDGQMSEDASQVACAQAIGGTAVPAPAGGVPRLGTLTRAEVDAIRAATKGA